MLTFRIVQVFLASKTSSILSYQTHFWKLLMCLFLSGVALNNFRTKVCSWYKFKNACKQSATKSAMYMFYFQGPLFGNLFHALWSQQKVGFVKKRLVAVCSERKTIGLASMDAQYAKLFLDMNGRSWHLKINVFPSFPSIV